MSLGKSMKSESPTQHSLIGHYMQEKIFKLSMSSLSSVMLAKKIK